MNEDQLDLEVYQVVNSYFEVRSMMKLEILNAWQSSLRAIMLLNLLQVPGFASIDQHYVAMLGIATNVISLVKQVQQIKQDTLSEKIAQK